MNVGPETSARPEESSVMSQSLASSFVRRNLMRGLAISGAGFAALTPSRAAPDPMAKNLAGQFAGTLSAHDIDAFAAYMAGMYAGDELEVTSQARELAVDIVLHPPVPLRFRPLVELVNQITIELLPTCRQPSRPVDVDHFVGKPWRGKDAGEEFKLTYSVSDFFFKFA